MGAQAGGQPKAPPLETGSAKRPQKADAAATPSEAPYQVTLEELDRYIRYRQESDAALISSMNTATQMAAGNAQGEIRFSLQEMYEADKTLREKHGLKNEGFQQLDRMVRDITEARFMPESAMTKAMLRIHDTNATTLPKEDPVGAMSRAMAAMIRKQMEQGPGLSEQRSRYGDANVDTLLRREQELKAIWTRKDAAAAKMFEAQSPSGAGSISL
jgi:hypothetical protein